MDLKFGQVGELLGAKKRYTGFFFFSLIFKMAAIFNPKMAFSPYFGLKMAAILKIGEKILGQILDS